MTILGFDTSTSRLTVAATDGRSVLCERDVAPEPSGRPRHARELLRAIEAVVGDAGGWQAVEKIAVGEGPGTFTGLRIGIATANALAGSMGVPVTGVSSLAALGLGALQAGRPVLAVADAKRGEVFTALFDHDRARWEPRVEHPAELAQRLRADGVAPVAAGEGAVRFRHELEAAGAFVPGDRDPAHRLHARHVCEMASERPGAREAVRPVYLRRPDAELWRERDHPSQTQS